jgi:hypothetical protein
MKYEYYEWMERDRKHVELRDEKTQETIIEFWDEAVDEEIEAGFLNPKDFEGSLLALAKERGFI